MMKVLRAADHKSMPWKNGGGVTTEVAVSPAGANMDSFEWRVSMARVDFDGPFSSFPGIDRTLAILEGEGLSLAIAGAAPVLLDKGSAPLAFAADQPTQGNLVSGPTLDLNVMVRRSGYCASVQRHHIAQTTYLSFNADTVMIFVNHGRVAVSHVEEENELHAKDCCLVSDPAAKLRLTPFGEAELFAVEIRSAT